MKTFGRTVAEFSRRPDDCIWGHPLFMNHGFAVDLVLEKLPDRCNAKRKRTSGEHFFVDAGAIRETLTSLLPLPQPPLDP